MNRNPALDAIPAVSQRGAVPAAEESTPWWRIGMVWVVLGGLGVGVSAGTTLAVIAHVDPDPVVSTPRVTAVTADAPARQARNHVSSPPPAASR